MTTFSASFDTRAFDAQIKRLSEIDQYGSFGRALSRAGQSMRKQAIFEAQSVLNLKAGPIRDVVDTRRVNRGDLKADLVITGRNQPVYEFKGVRQLGIPGRRTAGLRTRGGVSVQIKRTGARKVIRTAFIATMPSGKVGVFRRRINPSTGRSRTASLPIDLLFSTSVREALEDRSMQGRILKAGLDRFRPELAREITRRLGGSA